MEGDHQSTLTMSKNGSVSEDKINKAIADKGIISIGPQDLKGRKLLVLNLKYFVRGEFPLEDLQNIFIFFAEKLISEEKGKQISILFNFQVK